MGQVIKKDCFEWHIVKNDGEVVVWDCFGGYDFGSKKRNYALTKDGVARVEGESIEELEEKIKEL